MIIVLVGVVAAFAFAVNGNREKGNPEDPPTMLEMVKTDPKVRGALVRVGRKRTREIINKSLSALMVKRFGVYMLNYGDDPEEAKKSQRRGLKSIFTAYHESSILVDEIFDYIESLEKE